MSKFILCLESSTKVCSVAIFDGEKELAFREEASDKYIHSEQLAVFVNEVLNEAHVTSSSLAAVAVSSGPGSYTGLRIGVATAKGICYGADAKLIAIPTLEQLAFKAHAINNSFRYYLPMLDARRLEVFTQVHDTLKKTVGDIRAVEIDESSFTDLDKGSIAICGDGAAKCENILKKNNEVTLIELGCSARNMGVLAFDKLQREDFEDLAYFEPFYLKDFIAGKPKKLL